MSFFLLQVQRLAQYERYFQDLLAETPADHPDVDDLSRVRGRVKQVSHSVASRAASPVPCDPKLARPSLFCGGRFPDSRYIDCLDAVRRTGAAASGSAGVRSRRGGAA